MLLNQTTELEIIKQQVEKDKSTIKELETFKQQAENDRITIHLLQNRVFILEAELTKLNVSKPPSNQEFSTYLMSMNQLIHNMAANEENDKNLTNHLNSAVKQSAELQHALLNQSTELEHYKQQSESDRFKVYSIQNFTQKTDEKVNDLKTDMIQTRLNQTNELVDIKQQLEREKSEEYMLQNLTQRMNQRLDDLNLQVRYTSLSLLDLHSTTEQLNGSRISDVHDLIIKSM